MNYRSGVYALIVVSCVAVVKRNLHFSGDSGVYTVGIVMEQNDLMKFTL